MNDYYKILNTKRDASQEEIKKNYRKLSKQHHPDKGGNETKFKEISEAYATLGDETKRREYDEGPKRGNPFGFNGNPFNGGGPDMDDLFKQFFGRQQRRQQPQKPKGGDLSISLNVSLEDVFFGRTKKIKYRRNANCTECKGEGGTRKSCVICGGKGFREVVTGNAFIRQVHRENCMGCGAKGFTLINTCGSCMGQCYRLKEETVDLQIPKDLENGQELLYPGFGNEIFNGTPGNLRIKIIVENHKHFEFKGKDLIFKPKVNFIDWLLGVKIIVPHFNGDHTIPLPPLSEQGQTYMVRGQGMVRGGEFNGNLLIIPELKIPTKLTEKEIEKLKEIKVLSELKDTNDV